MAVNLSLSRVPETALNGESFLAELETFKVLLAGNLHKNLKKLVASFKLCKAVAESVEHSN